MPEPTFKTYKISKTAYEILHNIESASRLFESARTPRELEDAYAVLSKVRQIYVSYVEALEQMANAHGAQGIAPEITLRYE